VGPAIAPGASAGATILLVHGWGVSGALFEAQLASLSVDFRVVAPDLPGHGQSADFPEGAAFGWMADRLAALVRELGLRDLCLVGWSMGAMVSWDLLRRYPDLEISGLVTVDMVPRLLNDAGWRFGLREGADHHVFDRNIRWMRDDWAGYTRLFIPRIFAREANGRKRELEAHCLDIARGNAPGNMARIWACMVEQDFRMDLPRFRQPARVVAGALSQLYGLPAAEWITRQMPRAELLTFEHSGHAPHLEQPDAFNRALADFAAGLRDT